MNRKLNTIEEVPREHSNRSDVFAATVKTVTSVLIQSCRFCESSKTASQTTILITLVSFSYFFFFFLIITLSQPTYGRYTRISYAKDWKKTQKRRQRLTNYFILPLSVHQYELISTSSD